MPACVLRSDTITKNYKAYKIQQFSCDKDKNTKKEKFLEALKRMQKRTLFKVTEKELKIENCFEALKKNAEKKIV